MTLMTFALLASVELARAAGPVGSPPGGARELQPGHVPAVCTEADGPVNITGATNGYYWSETSSAWVAAPYCHARWGFLQATPSQVVQPGATVTITAIPDDGSMAGHVAVQGGMGWSHPGGAEAVVSGCGTKDVTCTVTVGEAGAEWKWQEFHITGPGRVFILPPSYAPRCQAEMPCLDTYTNAWSYIGIPPADADPSVSATLEATPAEVSVGDPFTITMRVTNPNATTTLTAVQPAAPISITDGEKVQLKSGPTPASIESLAPGATADFTWEFESLADGDVGFSATVEAQTSSDTVTADATCAVGGAALGLEARARDEGGCSALGPAAVKIKSVTLDLTSETQVEDKFVPGETIRYAIAITGCRPDSKMNISTEAPKGTTLVKGSSVNGTEKGNTVRWEFDHQRQAQVSFKALVHDTKKLPKDFKQIKAVAKVRCTLPAGEAATEDDDVLDRVSISLEAADASPEALGGIFLPDPKNAKQLPSFQWSGARKVKGIAADGVALLALRVATDVRKHGKVKLTVEAEGSAAPGSLWTTVDTSILDTDILNGGGHRDEMPEGPAAVAVKAEPDPNDKKQRLAFGLYRSPRNFDADGTAELQARAITLKVELFDSKDAQVIATADLKVDVVRPLVILQHGTFDKPDGWLHSSLHNETANELKGYEGFTTNFPFQTDRGNFNTYLGAAGDLEGSARIAWQALRSAIDNWKRVTGYAGTQVDVVCHSYGGVNMRWIAQSQGDGFNPVTPMTATNFRNATNWGHGLFHKLITIATTHRGSAVSNQLAFLNVFGLKKGAIRRIAEEEESWIDRGGVADQMVVSPILRQVRQTRVPGHVIAGSGLCERNSGYEQRLYSLWLGDAPGGPFAGLGQPYVNHLPDYAVFRKMSNYGFNLSGDELQDDTTQDPNYDLTVSSHSSKADMPLSAQSTVADLEATAHMAAGSLVGYVTHGDEIGWGGPTRDPVDAVALRVAFLLRQPTNSQYFAPFPPVGATLSPLEQTFSDQDNFNPAWLSEGLVSLSDATFGARSAGARAAGAVTIAIDPPATTVTPGQQVQVTVTSPTEGVERVLVTWPGAVAGDSNLRELTPGTAMFTMTIPDRAPGPFGLFALVLTTSDPVLEAPLDLEIVDPEPYTELRIDPAVLVLRSTVPGAFIVRGKLASGVWRTLNASSRLTLSNGNPAVVTVTPERTLEAGAPGAALITATWDGGLTATLEAQVSGETVPVAVAPRKKGKLKARQRRPTDFVFLSSSNFDPMQIDQASVRVGGVAPTRFQLKKDYNKDGIKDLAAYVSPQSLGLARGPVAVPMFATVTGGIRVAGAAIGLVR